MPLLAYPNSGEVYDTKTKTWHQAKGKQNSWEVVVEEFIDNGARIIGGCCRTSAKDISEIASAVDKHS